jgi:hypothetical protein
MGERMFGVAGATTVLGAVAVWTLTVLPPAGLVTDVLVLGSSVSVMGFGVVS